MSEPTTVASHDVEKGMNDPPSALTDGTAVSVSPVTAALAKVVERRPKWLACFVAEALGTACYVWAGVGATAAFQVSSAAKVPGFGDLFTIGWAYGLGALFGIIIAGPVSGGHLSPGFTLAFAVWKGFSWKMLLGAFIGALLVYEAYRTQIDAVTDGFRALGGDAAVFSPTGFIATTFLSIVVFTVLDTTNYFITLSTAPPYIAMAYAVCIWSFAPATVTLNTARDLGGRMAAAAIMGPGAFTHSPKYTAIGALTNILGCFMGACVHTLVISDPTRAECVRHPAVAPVPIGEPAVQHAGERQA